MRLLVAGGLRLVLVGGALGLALALVATRLLGGLLFEVDALDPLTTLAAAAGRAHNAVHGPSRGVAVRERITDAVAVAGAALLGVVLSGTYLGYWNPPLLSVDEGASGAPAAVLCLILGAMSWVMQRKEPNALIGLRTRWTLRSNRSWARSHRFAGQSSPVAAAVLIVPELLGVRLPGSILLGLFLAWLVLLWSYSYVQWRDDPDRVA